MVQQSFARRISAVLAVIFTLGMAGSPALATSQKEKAKKPAPGKSVKFIPGSQETAKERATRLKRECKGRVNAGACEGYTQ